MSLKQAIDNLEAAIETIIKSINLMISNETLTEANLESALKILGQAEDTLDQARMEYRSIH